MPRPFRKSEPHVQAALLRWYRRHRRSLPWRETRDPYRIWVSEIMLQQTRVTAVIPYYERFLERFPDVEALARAPEQDVLEAWSGLGYYRRARQMQAAARTVVDELGGSFPSTYDGLLALPGIGAYTAAAVASIAFGQPHAVVDGNVIRVLTRLLDDNRDVSRSVVAKSIAGRAQALIEEIQPSRAGNFNQAMMELGATLCTPRNPQCLLCPLRDECQARKNGVAEQRPVKKPKTPTVELAMAVAIVPRGRSLLLRQRPETEAIMPGFWELPQAEGPALNGDCFEHLGIQLGPQVATFRHGITFRSYRGTSYEGKLTGRLPAGYRWVRAEDLETLPLTTVSRKALGPSQPTEKRARR